MVGGTERNQNGKLSLSELEKLIYAGTATAEQTREFFVRRDLDDEGSGHGSLVPSFSDYLGESRFTPTWDAIDPQTGDVHRHPCTIAYCSQCGAKRPRSIQDNLQEGVLGRYRAHAGRRKGRMILSFDEAEEMDGRIEEEANPERSLYD